MKRCESCGQYKNKLIKVDDAYLSAMYTEAAGAPYMYGQDVCLTCALDILDIEEGDLIRETRLKNKNSAFALRCLKGGLAQTIVKAILLEFGYDVFPYGYESYFTNIIKSMKGSFNNPAVSKIRSTPDLFAYDQGSKKGFLIEVKSTTVIDESRYYLQKYILDDYFKYWPEMILVVCCVKSMNIYCRSIREIFSNGLPECIEKFNKDCYVLNLKNDFYDLFQELSLIDADGYYDFRKRIIDEVLSQFNSTKNDE